MKKKALIIVYTFLSILVYTQVPQSFSYQAVLRDSQGVIQGNESLNINISIVQGSIDGSIIFSESHTTQTNEIGLFALNIGSENTSDFSLIDWADGPYFISINVNGQDFGTSQLVSVPYAIHSRTAEELSSAITENDPVFSGWDKNSGILITESQISDLKDYLTEEVDGSVTNEIQTLSISDNNLSISNGNSVRLPLGGATIPVYTTSEIDLLSPEEGDAVFNKTEKLFQIFDGSTWNSFFTSCWPPPTVSNAGPDQIFIDETVSATLNANAPEVGHGIGEWSIEKGGSGTFSNMNDPNATFTGTENSSYTLVWTISTDCGHSRDEVNINFNQANITGMYTVTVYRDGTLITPYDTVIINSDDEGGFRTSQVGHWSDFESPEGTRGFAFYREENSIIIPEQKVLDYYTNILNSDGLDPGTIDPETGIIQLSYKITSSWESLYEWTLEPISVTPVLPSVDIDLENYPNDSNFLILYLEWDNAEDNVDILIYHDEVVWGYAASSNIPEVDNSIHTDDPDGNYYINILPSSVSAPFDFRLIIAYPDGSHEYIEGVCPNTGTDDQYEIIKVTKTGTEINISPLVDLERFVAF